MVGLRISTTAVIISENVFYFIRNLYLGIVTDELTHSSPKSDVIFQDIDKLLRRLHGVDIRDQGKFFSNDLCHSDTSVHGWGVTEDGVCGYSFFSSDDVNSWKPGFEVFPHGKSSGCDCSLSGIFKGFLDGICIDPTKIRFQLFLVYVGRLLNMFLDSSDVLFRNNRECLNCCTQDVTTFINPGIMLISC